jgi:NAD kinase
MIKTDSGLPRIVLVTRKTQLEVLRESRGTLDQVRFYLKSRGQREQEYEEAHERFHAGLSEVQRAIPPDWRRTRVDRDELDRFLFAPEDLVVVVGQDGLVPNVAKYLNGQLAIGINPDPERYDGVLCQHPPGSTGALLKWVETRQDTRFRVEHRVMALAEREDGQRLLALNEVFVGYQTHQSARYRIRAGGKTEEERHSSSGVICSTGTGSTGWARSISLQLGRDLKLPAPEETRLAWFVREPFPSVATQTGLRHGHLVPGEALTLSSEMGEGGVIFADGIESDRLEFLSGHRVTVGIAPSTFNLVARITPGKDLSSAAVPAGRRKARNR